MDFCNEYPRLELAQQERFRAVATALLAGQVLVPGTALKPNPEWRFVERFESLLDAYLRIGGWRLELDRGLQLARAVHELGEMRVRFNKLESLVLCTLRLAYHEEHQRMSQGDRVELTVGALRERLIQSGRSALQLQRRSLTDALRRLQRHSLVSFERGFEGDDAERLCVLRLQRHSLVSFERGFEGDDAERLCVLPLVEKVLPADRIAELAQRVKEYNAPASEEPLDAEPADAPLAGSPEGA
jgi:hypothetical protein